MFISRESVFHEQMLKSYSVEIGQANLKFFEFFCKKIYPSVKISLKILKPQMPLHGRYENKNLSYTEIVAHTKHKETPPEISSSPKKKILWVNAPNVSTELFIFV
jgi:hypothetical protein